MFHIRPRLRNAFMIKKNNSFETPARPESKAQRILLIIRSMDIMHREFFNVDFALCLQFPCLPPLKNNKKNVAITFIRVV